MSGALVRHSLLFNNVRVNSFSTITDSVLLPGTVVGRHCHIHRAVINSDCHIPEGTEIGRDTEADRRRFYITPGGVALVCPQMLGEQARYGT